MNRLGIDYGLKRVGVALAKDSLKIAYPLMVLDAESALFEELDQLIATHQIEEIVVGLPRSLAGDDTDQTRLTRLFIDQLQSVVSVPVQAQDEAGTSARAKEQGATSDIDAAAAAIILQDYLEQN